MYIYFSVPLEQLWPIEIYQPFLMHVSHMCNLKFPNSHIKKKSKKKQVKLILMYFI